MCGACWAFVATASVEAQVRIAGGKQIPLSVQELVDCDTALNRLVVKLMVRERLRAMRGIRERKRDSRIRDGVYSRRQREKDRYEWTRKDKQREGNTWNGSRTRDDNS